MESLHLLASVASEVYAAVAAEEGVVVLAAVSWAKDPFSFDAPGSPVQSASAAPVVVSQAQSDVVGDPPLPCALEVLKSLQLMRPLSQCFLPVLFKNVKMLKSLVTHWYANFHISKRWNLHQAWHPIPPDYLGFWKCNQENCYFHSNHGISNRHWITASVTGNNCLPIRATNS